MKKTEICHLHTHTEYSLLDGHSEIERLVDRAVELNQRAMAITDHGSLYGIIDFYKACKRKGVKPVLGSEFYLCDNMSERAGGYSHIVLLAKNNDGLKNLYKLSSLSFTDGFYSKPRIDKELLKKYSDGIICLTGCLNGRIPQYISENNLQGAYNEANELMGIFGRENMYVELQNHNIPEEIRVTPVLVRLADKLGLKCVVTNDIHYVDKEDSLYQDVLMCVSMQKKFDDPERLKFATDEFYLKSTDEMIEAFENLIGREKTEECIKNAEEVAEKCNVEIEFHKLSFPKFFEDKTKSQTEKYFRELCRKGLKMRYGSVSDEISARLEYEMDTICEMGFCDYFLIVWDFVRFAKTNGIAVGPGRGSAAGSLVSYTLNITTVDPIKYKLVFERFLNKERVSMPDIDIDFCNERREEVIDYVVKKYGKNRVSRILTFGTLKARAAIKDVARVMGIPYFKADEVTKLIPPGPRIKIDDVLKSSKRLSELYENDSEIKKLIDISKKIEGHLRHGSVHAAGVLITGEETRELCPLTVVSGTVATQFEMGTIEELGLLKMDFLGLRNLSIIKNTIAAVGEEKNVSVNFSDIGYEDPEVYKMLAKGDTDGVFQLESGGMKRFLQELKPKCLEDVIAAIALYRPGPMAKIPEFIRNKENPDKITYKCPELKGILDVTYGCIVYQEQVMEIFRTLGGYSYGQADIVRKAISKKKADVLSEQRSLFIEGCGKNNVSESIAKEIFSDIEAFADYAFNKSHSVCYSMVAYETAYLKCKFPAYFFASVLSTFMDFTEKISFYITSSENMGIKTLPPRINASEALFTVKENSVVYGLAAIKGIGKNMAELIIEERNKSGEFLSFNDFLERMVTHRINRLAVEALIKAGCFEGFGHRLDMLRSYESDFDAIVTSRRTNAQGQISLTQMFRENDIKKRSEYNESMIEPPTKTELEMEREVLGLYISGHPLREFIALIKEITPYEIFDVKERFLSRGEATVEKSGELTFVGIIKDLSLKRTKTGRGMAVFNIEDISGMCECVAFPKVYEQCEIFLKNDNIVEIRGRAELDGDDKFKFIVSCVYEFEKTPPSYKLYLRIEEKNRDKISRIKSILKMNHGNTPVYFYYPETNKTFIAPNEYRVAESRLLISELSGILGEENVKTVEKI